MRFAPPFGIGTQYTRRVVYSYMYMHTHNIVVRYCLFLIPAITHINCVLYYYCRRYFAQRRVANSNALASSPPSYMYNCSISDKLSSVTGNKITEIKRTSFGRSKIVLRPALY